MGRDEALAAVTGALKDGPALVLIEGEAGIGKTRLVQELFASRAAEQYRVLVAVCPPFREALTLGPVVDAIRQTRGSVAGLRLSALAGALRPVFPEWAAELPPAPEPLDDAKASRHRLLSALADLVERVGVGLLVVEDAHWADEATMEFLLLLTSRQRPPSLIVTYRPEDVPAGSLLLRLSSRVPAGLTHARLTLEPLDQAATASLVSSMLDGGPVSDEFADFLHGHTDGLPLLVEESVRLLHDRADLIRRDGEWVRRSLEELQVPPTVRDAVLERLDRLSGAAARGVLDAAAVFAEPVEQAMVGQVAGLDANRARHGLTEALASGLVGEDGRQRVAFHHDLLGRAVYEAIPGPVRRRLHLAAGNALEATDPLPVVQLARHFREAGETAKWAEYAEQSAERAIASNDQTTAARLLNDVLSTAVLSADTGARLAPKLARATLFRSEDVDDLNRAVVSTLRTMLDSQELNLSEQAVIRNLLGRLLAKLGDWETGYRELELAAADLNDPVEAARVMTYLAFPFVGSKSASVHRKWLQRAAALDSSLQSPVDRINLTADRATALLLLGDEQGWELAAGLPTAAVKHDERSALTRAYSNLADVSIVWGRYPDASRCLTTAREFAEADGYSRQAIQAELDWFSGRWDGLADRLTVLIDIDGHEVEQPGYGGTLSTAGCLRAAQGARDQAEKHFRLALERARLHSLVDDALEPAAGLARLRLVEGDIADALEITDHPMQTVLRKGIWIWATDIAPVRVEALIAAGSHDEAELLMTKFARGLRGRNAPAPRAALAMCRALVAEGRGSHDRAVSAFARAANAWNKLPRPYDALLARERQAQCMLTAGRTEAGLPLLAEVYERLFDLGARGDADRVAQGLREHGADVPRLWRGGRHGYGDQLSPRELEVVLLVVAGKTNREIARVLSKSPKTVAMQVRSAMRKLDVSSRTALAVSAIQAGVVLGEPHRGAGEE